MKNILITGGSGFLGRHLAALLKKKGYSVVLGSRNNDKNRIVHETFGMKVMPLDITNIESVRDAINRAAPDVIIHAAATKYVDTSETYPHECVDVNVLGSQNVARVAIDYGVDSVIGISTDKTAPPVNNTYGMSKAIMERIFCSLNNVNGTKFTNVRFGNIAWSTGSVFPIWLRMTKEKGHIESTGPHMRRFFFSVEDASYLVYRALINLELTQGKVLCQSMKSAQVDSLLDVWCKKYNCEWSKVGERVGDKIDEYLIGISELKNTSKIMLEDIPHFLIDFKTNNNTEIKEPITSENSERLSIEEIERLVDSKPQII